MADPLNPIQQGQQDEEENQQQGNQQPVMGAQQATVQGGGMQTAQQPAAPQQKGSGRFTNLQGFLQANKGFAQKQGGLAGKMAQKVGTQVGQAQQTLATEKQKFGQTLGGIKQEAVKTKEGINPSLGYLKSYKGTQLEKDFDIDESGNLVSLKQPAQPGQMKLAVESQDSQTSAPSLTDKEAEENIRRAIEMKYTGPERLGAEKELEAQKQTLGELGQATASQEGRFGLLKRFFGKPTYSSGQQRLDQLLVQGNQPQLQKLLGARQQTAQFGGAFDKTRQQALQDVAMTRADVQNIAGQAKTETSAAADAASAQLQKNIEQRNKLVRDVEMMGTQGREELKQALANAGLDTDDLRIALDPQLAFENPEIANAVLAATSQATEGTLDLQAASRINALRNLAGRKDLIAVGTEAAGRDINVGVGGRTQSTIAQNKADIDLYKKAAQGSGAFSGEEEAQMRNRFMSEKIASGQVNIPQGVDKSVFTAWAANGGAIPTSGFTAGQINSLLTQLGMRRDDKGNLVQTGTGPNPAMFQAMQQARQGLNSKEDVVKYARDSLGARLRNTFGFLGKGY